MIVKDLIDNVNTDAELTALTGMSSNTFAFHNGNSKLYRYEPKFKTGAISSTDGGFWVEEHLNVLNLAEYKAARYIEVDQRTNELILQGFSYASIVFSMSENAQTNILALDHTRNDPALTYPITYNSMDDLSSYDIVDATDLHNMYLTALGTKKARQDSGTTIKDSIRNAIDAQAVAAIIDNR